MRYEQFEIEGQAGIKRFNDDGTTSFIPIDPANSDYQEYLKSLEA